MLAVYGYDNLGRRSSIARGNGVSTSYEYDAAGRLEELAHELASTANDVSFAYAHNAAGQQIERDRTASNSAYVWPQPANSVQLPSANGLNQIAQIGGTSFSYDGRGNLTSDGTTTYAYDIYNRLTSAAGQTYGYDPAGRLYQTTGSTSTRRFLYDGVDRIAEYNSSGAMVRRFVHGPGLDEPVLWYEGDDTSTRRWYIQDELGSVIALANASGAASYINSYDEYGRPAASNNIASRFQYTGQVWLEGGIYHYKARAYAPALGRFLQTDPILYAGGLNLYAYVGNDPVNWIDPFGLWRTVCEMLPPTPDGGAGAICWRTADNHPGLRPDTGVPTMPGDAGGGPDGGGGESEEEEEDQDRECALLARAVQQTRAAVGSATSSWRWNDPEALHYDMVNAMLGAESFYAVAGVLGPLAFGRNVSAGLGRPLPGGRAGGWTGAAIGGVAGFSLANAMRRERQVAAYRARLEQLEAELAGRCPTG